MDVIVFLFHVLLIDPITNVLVALARLSGGNFGIAIIIFTVLMKFATWPLTVSQLRSSRQMQSIQPKVQELQKKYKGKDPKKLQAETMALYREAGINPLGCIFPLLIQMPIWFALYQAIRVTLGEAPESLVTLSQRLYPIPFIHQAVPLNNGLLFWNLGQPDTTLVLPILTALTMYVQQKLITPTPTAASADSSAAQTQQMMAWMMPLMFGYFSYQVPAGLALYWTISNVMGIVLQYFYMGRRVDWSSMLNITGSPPADTRRRGTSSPARGDVPANTRAASTQDLKAPEGDGTTDAASGAAAVVGASSGTRRKRHARRRGKR